MSKNKIILFFVIGLIVSNPVLAQEEEEEPESRSIPLSPGEVTFSVENGYLNISAQVQAYPKAKLTLNDSSDGEDYGPRENASSETKEYELIFEKADGVESLYETNITVSKQIEIDSTTDVLLTYRVSESDREIRRMRSGTLVTVTPESITSLSKNNFVNSIEPGDSDDNGSSVVGQQQSDQVNTQPRDSYGQGYNVSKTGTINSLVEIKDTDFEVSQAYKNEIDEMSKEELQNRVIYLRKKVVKLEAAMVGISQSVSTVEDMVEADVSSDGIDVDESQEKQSKGIWGFIPQNLF